MVNLTTKGLIDFFEGKLREADKIDPVGDEDGFCCDGGVFVRRVVRGWENAMRIGREKLVSR